MPAAAWTRRWTAVAVALGVGLGLALPSAAMARGPEVLLFGPVTDHGYKVRGVVTTAGATTGTLELVLSRAAGDQLEQYTFRDAEPVSLSTTAGLGSARLQGRLGSAGSVSLRFQARGAVTPRPLGALHLVLGCHAVKHPTRRGEVVGSFRLDTHTVFGTIHGHDVPASLIASQLRASETCPEGAFSELRLNGESSLSHNLLTAERLGSSADAVASFTRPSSTGGPISLEGFAVQFGSGSLFTSSGVQTAAVAADGPFLSGSAQFTATAPCSLGASFGSVTGSVTAHFLIGGDQVYPSVTTTPSGPTPPDGSPNPFGILSTSPLGCQSG